MVYITSGTFNHAIVTMCLIVGTLYGLNFYYEGHDYGSQIKINIMEEQSFLSKVWSDFQKGAVDAIMELLSILNPFILLKLFLYEKLDYSTFQALNLFIMRPIGWVILFMESEWVINKIRGVSG